MVLSVSEDGCSSDQKTFAVAHVARTPATFLTRPVTQPLGPPSHMSVPSG